MALFLLCPNLGWIQGQFNFTELSLRYPWGGGGTERKTSGGQDPKRSHTVHSHHRWCFSTERGPELECSNTI